MTRQLLWEEYVEANPDAHYSYSRFTVLFRQWRGTAYGNADMLNWLVEEKRIEPHIPVWDKSNSSKDIFNRSDFAWDTKANQYTCPV